jgi:hypothetical protein
MMRLEQRRLLHWLLDMAGVLAVQPDPATGVAGVFGGEPGCLFGSGVGHDRDRLVGHGDHPPSAGTVRSVGADGWWPIGSTGAGGVWGR